MGLDRGFYVASPVVKEGSGDDTGGGVFWGRGVGEGAPRPGRRGKGDKATL